MNEIGWFVAGIEFVVIILTVSAMAYASREMGTAEKKIKEYIVAMKRVSREIEEYVQRREKDAETIEELEENIESLYEAAGLDEDAKFMDVVRLIRKHRQDSEEYARMNTAAASPSQNQIPETCKFCGAKKQDKQTSGLTDFECGTWFVPEDSTWRRGIGCERKYAVLLEDLVRHCQIHSGYRNCGYDQMSSELKAVYDEINERESK